MDQLRVELCKFRLDGNSARGTKVESVTTGSKSRTVLSNNAPTLANEWDAAGIGITGQEMHRLVLDTEPRIIFEGGSGSRPHS